MLPNGNLDNTLLTPGSSYEGECFGRRGIINSIHKKVTKPEPVVVNLVGPRWIGKTTVLRCLKPIDDKTLFVYADLSSVPDRSNPFVSLADEIFRVLEKRDDINLHSIAQEIELGASPEDLTPRIVESRLRRLPAKAARNNIRLVICLDHLDKSGLLNDGANIRQLELLTASASLILATRKTLTDIYPGLAGSPFVHNSIVLPLDQLGRRAAEEMLKSFGEDGEVQFSQDDMDVLIQIVGRHPYILYRAGEQAYELLLESDELRERGFTVSDCRRMIEPSLRPYFEGLWQEYGDVIEKYHRLEKDPQVSETRKRAVRQELQTALLIYEDPKIQWKFNYFSPLFESFVIQKIEGSPNESEEVIEKEQPTIDQMLEILDVRQGTKESKVLTLLVENVGSKKPVSDSTLQAQFWSGKKSDRGRVNTIQRLRDKLEKHQDQINGEIVRVREEGFTFQWLSGNE